jgi:hypothetical protein
MIEEIKSLKKEELFKVPPKNKTNVFSKILKIFGYG